MSKFIPRHITADMVAQGYNNEGRGQLLGYIARPEEHERTCRYRISTRGDPNKSPHETCTCRVGLWQEETIVAKMRKSRKLAKPKPTKKKPASKKAARGMTPPDPAEEAVERDESAMLQLIDERDAAEQALSQAFYLTTGRSPEWSNLFGHDEALQEIKDALDTMRGFAALPPRAGLTETQEKRLDEIQRLTASDDGTGDEFGHLTLRNRIKDLLSIIVALRSAPTPDSIDAAIERCAKIAENFFYTRRNSREPIDDTTRVSALRSHETAIAGAIRATKEPRNG